MGRHRSDPRGLVRYLLLGVVAVVALALVIVGVLALRGALSSKKPDRPPTSTRNAAQQTPSTPAVLTIKVVQEPCMVFVKNSGNGNVLEPDNTSVPRGTTLKFTQTPLLVQISNPACVNVFVHGQHQPSAKAKPWIFSVQS
ncbi:MAG: hypothetical protein ACM3ML_23680 [Micromonosporaceae bacterium]